MDPGFPLYSEIGVFGSLSACVIIMTVYCGVCQFGESQKLRLVRILRSTVMVRVGGGWVALDEFLVKNDPCRGMSCSLRHQTCLQLLGNS